MERKSFLDRQRLLGWVVAGSGQFVVLTLAAMFAYPGGTVTDPTTSGYSFFHNFFSDLGRTVSPLGTPNTVAAVLFATALTLAGLALVLFSAIMPSLLRRPPAARVPGLFGSLFGILSGLSFVGVAFTPANLFLSAHKTFVQAAFLCFFAAVLGLMAAILLAEDYPRRYVTVFAVFAVLLAGYLWLLFFGPDLDSSRGLIIQATGQKIIAYAAILSVGIQALGARRLSGATHS
jgi:hypothetical membrane protein